MPFDRTVDTLTSVYVLGLLSIAIVLFGLHALASFLFSVGPSYSTSHLSDPLVLLRLITVQLSQFFAPMVFWLLIVIRRYVTRSAFSSEKMGATTAITGLIMLAIAQGPAVFVHGWLQAKYAAIYHSLYGLGWCFVLVGILCSARIRNRLLSMPMGSIALIVGLAWWLLGPLIANLGLSSLVLAIVSILSMTSAFLGVLSFEERQRRFAMGGVVLMTLYAFFGPLGGGIGWFRFTIVFDRRLMTPLDLISRLGWMATIGWAMGIFSKCGHPLADSRRIPTD